MSANTRPEGGHRRVVLVIVLAGLSIAIVAVTLALVIAPLMRVQQFDGVRINVAGRQRMLSQKMLKEALLVEHGGADPAQVRQSMGLFDANLRALIDGGMVDVDGRGSQRELPPTRDEATRAQLDGVLDLWVHHSELLEEYLSTADPTAIDLVMRVNTSLLDQMDATVQLMQAGSERNSLVLGWVIAVAGAGTLLALLVLVGKKISDLSQARSAIEQLQRLLPICATCKKIRRDGSDPEDPSGWIQPEVYMAGVTDVQFSHGICPGCLQEMMESLERPAEAE